MGSETVLQALGINADVMFFSALGITEDGIISDNDREQCAVRRAVMKNARKTVCLMEEGKMGKKFTYILCKAEDITEVII